MPAAIELGIEPRERGERAVYVAEGVVAIGGETHPATERIPLPEE